MAISIVASTGQGVINGGQMSMNFGTVAASDIAIVACCLSRGTTVTHAVLSSAGTPYTQIVPTVTQTSVTLSVWAKLLTVNDTTVTASGTGSNSDGDSAVVTVIRGAVFNGIKTSSAQVGSGTTPDSPAVAVGSTAAITLSIIGAEVATTTPTVSAIPASYSSDFNAGVSDTNSTRCAISHIIQSDQGSQNPGAYTLSATSTWIGVSVALFSSGSVYFPMPDQWLNPPDYTAQQEMIPYGLDRLHSSATGLP